MKLFRTQQGIVIEQAGQHYSYNGGTWDQIVARDDAQAFLQSQIDTGRMPKVAAPVNPKPPVTTQEIWASGVTYMRSMEARMEESKDSGGGTFYDRVYSAERPELFFKSAGHRAVGTGGKVRIRKDSKWNVPEPELVLVVNARNEFDVLGTFVRERGGPVRVGDVPDSHPAAYAGSVTGTTMVLVVRLTDTNEVIGSFALSRDSPGRVAKCLLPLAGA